MHAFVRELSDYLDNREGSLNPADDDVPAIVLGVNDGDVDVTFTLTTPGCPMHASFKDDIEMTLWRALPGLRDVSVALVWQPPWTPDMLTPEGRAELGLF